MVALALLLLIAGWELCRPRRRCQFSSTRRRIANVTLWLMNLFFIAFFLGDLPGLGPRNALPWSTNFVLIMVLGFLVLDFVRYAVHRLEHAVPLFWRFHALHHSDPEIDVTTTLRHHPVEDVVLSGIYWIVATVLGMPASVAGLYAAVVFVMGGIQHGNFSLPSCVERWLQPFLNTPDLHLIHHSASMSEANSNYGAVLSIWDRLFGTFTQISRRDQQAIVFGVRGLPVRDCMRLSRMLATPWFINRLGPTPGQARG